MASLYALIQGDFAGNHISICTSATRLISYMFFFKKSNNLFEIIHFLFEIEQ